MGTSSTPSRRRQPSTSTGSGPASSTTARPAPRPTTSASPWPTSQATIAQPAGGQAGASTRMDRPLTATPTQTAAASHRTRRRRSTKTDTTMTVASASAPAGPEGQGTTAPGVRAARSAIQTIQRSGQSTRRSSTSPSHGENGVIRAAARPSTVTIATTGTTKRLAGSEIRLTLPTISTSSGAVNSPAAAQTDVATARGSGTPRALSCCAQTPAATMMPAVAATDRANPRSRAKAGSKDRSTKTAAASAGIACRVRPVARASNVTAPMAAARRTLGWGPTRTTNAASASAQITARVTGRNRLRRNGHRTAPITMAQLVPDTAVRWDRPLIRKSSTRTASIPAVSPRTMPRRSPASSESSVRSARSRRPPRISAAPESSTPSGGADASGGPLAKAIPTSMSWGAAVAMLTVADTVVPGTSSAHPCAGAKTRTSPLNVQDRMAESAHGAPQVRASTLPGTRTREPLAPGARMRTASVTRNRSRMSASPVANWRSGEVSRAWMCETDVPAIRPNPANASASAAVLRLPVRSDTAQRGDRPTSSADKQASAAANAMPNSSPADRSGAAHAVSQPNDAAGTRRRSQSRVGFGF